MFPLKAVENETHIGRKRKKKKKIPEHRGVFSKLHLALV